MELAEGLEPDQAKSQQRYQQALAAFSAGGVVSGKAAVIGNLGITYLNLGLVHRARRLLLESDRMQRDLGNKLGIVTNAWNLLLNEQLLRHPDAARIAADTAALTKELGSRRFAGHLSYVTGRFALLEGRAAEAVADFERAVEELGAADDGQLMEFLTQYIAYVACADSIWTTNDVTPRTRRRNGGDPRTGLRARQGIP